MAKKRRKHGRVEAAKQRPRIQFRIGALLGIIAGTFLLCFLIYMVRAVSSDTYWEEEGVASMENEQKGGAGKSGGSAGVTNPVPSSERADDSRIQECAFIGDVSGFINRYETNTSYVFTDTVLSMSESRMRSIARSMKSDPPTAAYIWYQVPEDPEKAQQAVASLADALHDQIGVPVYLLTAIPAADADTNRRVDTWNAALFSLADEMGLHYVDINTTLKANDGTLSPTYQDEEVLYNTVYDQILTHVAD